ncbi:MAG: pyridoxamine 5-phosphate oxidase [Nonomuraea sp.]|nr:pyridoxamine 5-phosphate oxidase [Nonomuraea sp.]
MTDCSFSATEGDVMGSFGERHLQQLCGTEARAARFYSDQMTDHLNPLMCEFVARQEMVFVSTADGEGSCDATFRAGPAGFVTVLDPHTLAFPEYRGNGVLASLGNIVENPHVGLLFVDFFRDLVGLHVNGRAAVVADLDIRAAHPGLPVPDIPGRRAERWVVTSVEEAYIHCSKHIPRLARLPRQRHWGTDDVRRKGGDFFEVKGSRANAPT